MKKLVISMSLMVAMSLGSLVQAQSLGDQFNNNQEQNLQPPSQSDVNRVRLQEVQELQQQVQEGEQSAIAAGQRPQLPPGSRATQIPGQGLPGQGLPGQGLPDQELAGQGLAGQGLPGQGLPDQGLAGQELAGQGLPGQTSELLQQQLLQGQAPPPSNLGQESAGPGVVVEEGVEVAIEVRTQELSIGVVIEPLPGAGMKVIAVRQGSEAELIGLHSGDLIKAVNRIPISSAPQFEALLQQALELHLNRLNILVRNAHYGIDHEVPEYAILQLRLVQEHRPVVVETYRPYGGYHEDNHYDNHYDNHHYDNHRHVEYIQPRRSYGGGCHR